MKLLQKQFEFGLLLPLLLAKATELGYQYTMGEILRSQEEANRLAKLGVGSKNSVHRLKLAVDLNLFRDGVYQTSSEAHRALGTYWESLSAGKDFTTHWGGHWGDGNHYSIGHGGVK
jgi:hypothetical protein